MADWAEAATEWLAVVEHWAEAVLELEANLAKWVKQVELSAEDGDLMPCLCLRMKLQ